MRPPGIDRLTGRLVRNGELSMQQLNSGLKRGRVFSRACRARSGGVLFLCVRSNRIRLLTSRILVPGHSHTSPPLGPPVWKILHTFDRHRRPVRRTWQIGAPSPMPPPFEKALRPRGSIGAWRPACLARDWASLLTDDSIKAPGSPVLPCHLEASTSTIDMAAQLRRAIPFSAAERPDISGLFSIPSSQPRDPYRST